MYTFLSVFIISMKSNGSQRLRGNESKLLAKSLHWSFESFLANSAINVSILIYLLILVLIFKINKKINYNKNMMVILLFTPCVEDKIVFPDLIFLFLDFR